MAGFLGLFSEKNTGIFDIRDDNIRFYNSKKSKYSYTDIEDSLTDSIESILAVNKFSDVLLSLNTKNIYSGMVNIGHFSITDDLYEILRWRFFQEKNLQPSEFELTFIPVFSKKINNNEENYYFVSAIRKALLSKIKHIFKTFRVKIREILVPSYIISKACYLKYNDLDSTSIYFSEDRIFVSVYFDGKPIYYKEIEMSKSIYSSNYLSDYVIDMFFGIANYLSEIYSIQIRPEKIFVGFESSKFVEIEIPGLKVINLNRAQKVEDCKMIFTSLMKEIVL